MLKRYEEFVKERCIVDSRVEEEVRILWASFVDYFSSRGESHVLTRYDFHQLIEGKYHCRQGKRRVRIANGICLKAEYKPTAQNAVEEAAIAEMDRKMRRKRKAEEVMTRETPFPLPSFDGDFPNLEEIVSFDEGSLELFDSTALFNDNPLTLTPPAQISPVASPSSVVQKTRAAHFFDDFIRDRCFLDPMRSEKFVDLIECFREYVVEEGRAPNFMSMNKARELLRARFSCTKKAHGYKAQGIAIRDEYRSILGTSPEEEALPPPPISVPPIITDDTLGHLDVFLTEKCFHSPDNREKYLYLYDSFIDYLAKDLKLRSYIEKKVFYSELMRRFPLEIDRTAYIAVGVSLKPIHRRRAVARLYLKGTALAETDCSSILDDIDSPVTLDTPLRNIITPSVLEGDNRAFLIIPIDLSKVNNIPVREIGRLLGRNE